MSLSLLTAGLSVTLLSPLTAALADEPEAMSLILTRYRGWLLSGTAPEAEVVRKDQQSLQPDGAWPDIDYTDTDPTGWDPGVHLQRVGAMALAYSREGGPLQGDAELQAAMWSALDHWLANRYQCPNWWHNQIGVPRAMRDIAILLDAELEGERRQGALEVLGQLRVGGTGANLAWSAELSLHHGCLRGDAPQVGAAAERIWDEVKVGAPEGIQDDWSFFQHGARLQAFHYGRSYLDVVTKIGWQLRDTPWAMPDEKRTIISNCILEGLQWMCRGIYTVPGTMDRQASRRDRLRAADLRSLLELWREVHPERQQELDAFLARQQGEGEPLTGFRHFPRADFTAYHRPGFSIFLKTISTRTLPTESINHENLKGVPYLNHGDHYLLRDGQEYYNLQPVWEWARLPGLTLAQQTGGMARTLFAGGLGNGESGLTALDYRRSDGEGRPVLAARKLWAFHRGMMICLIGGWEVQDDTGGIVTSLEQCRLRGPVQANVDGATILLPEGVRRLEKVRWLLHQEVGYIPLGASAVGVQPGPATGSWHDINRTYDDRPVTEPVLLIEMEHSSLPGPGGFLIVPEADAGRLDALLEDPPWEILRNDSQCQALRFEGGLQMAAFYTPTSVPGLQVSQPCLALWTGESLWLCDPTGEGKGASVVWQGTRRSIELPVGGRALHLAAPQ